MSYTLNQVDIDDLQAMHGALGRILERIERSAAGGAKPMGAPSEQVEIIKKPNESQYPPQDQRMPKTIKPDEWEIPARVGESVTLESGLVVKRVIDVRGPYSTHPAVTGGNDPIIVVSDGSMIRRSNNKHLGRLGSNRRRASWYEDDVIYYTKNTQLRRFEYGGSDTLLHDFSENGASGVIEFGEAEGNFCRHQDKVCMTHGSKKTLILHSYSVKKGYMGSIDNDRVIKDAQQFRLDGAGLQDRINGGWIDNATFCKQGKYIVVVVKDSEGKGVCYVRYNADFTDPVILGTYADGKFWKLRAQHKTMFVGLQGETLIMSDHWDGSYVVDLDEPHKVYYVQTKGGGHYCGNAMDRPGHVLYSDNKDPGLIQMVRFDKREYEGTVPIAEKGNAQYVGFYHKPVKDGYRETWLGSGFADKFPGTLATCNTQGDEVYFNVGNRQKQIFMMARVVN